MQALKVSFCFFEYILPQITEKVNQLLEIFALYYNLTKKHQMLKKSCKYFAYLFDYSWSIAAII